MNININILYRRPVDLKILRLDGDYLDVDG
jgi:hypothetical protein